MGEDIAARLLHVLDDRKRRSCANNVLQLGWSKPSLRTSTLDSTWSLTRVERRQESLALVLRRGSVEMG